MRSIRPFSDWLQLWMEIRRKRSRYCLALHWGQSLIIHKLEHVPKWCDLIFTEVTEVR